MFSFNKEKMILKSQIDYTVNIRSFFLVVTGKNFQMDDFSLFNFSK